MAQVTSTFTPSSRPRGFTWAGFSPRAYRDLLTALVTTQIKVRYRNTFVGLGWAVLNPALQVLVYAYVFGEIFSGDRSNFRLVLLAGLLPWQAFATALVTSVRSLIAEQDLLKKAPFPSELLPIASVLSAMVNFAIVFCFFVAYLAFRGFIVPSVLPWVILALLIELIFAVGISLTISALNVFFRDLEQLVGFGVWIWFFLTPIIYPLARLGEEQTKLLLAVNPMAVVVTTVQNALLKGEPGPIEPLALASAIALVSLGIGWWTFRRLQYEIPKAV